MRPDRLSKLGSNYHTGSLSSRTTSEKHYPATSILERSLEKANRNAERHTGAAKVSLVAGDGPGILLQLLQDLGELEFALLDGHEEASGSERLGRHGLAGFRSGTGVPRETKHVLDLFGLVFLSAAEDVGFGAFGIANFVYLGLGK